MKNIFTLLVCLFVSIQIFAQVRQKDSHEHGAATLMLVIEGDKLQIGIEVPSDSLIGFEHFPRSKSDRENFSKAIKIFSEPSRIFLTPDVAECLLTGINVSQTLFSGEGQHGHDDHGHKEKGFWENLFGHDDHEHDDHGHQDSNKEEIHSEYRSNYSWNCLNTGALDSIDNNLFSIFPRIEEIRVKWITINGQGSFELEPGNNKIRGWK